MEVYIKKKNNELYHYGVLGMKWGVRRYQNKDGTLTAAGKKRLVKSIKNTSTIDAAYHMTKTLSNNKDVQSYKSSNSAYKTAYQKQETYIAERDKFYKKQANASNKLISQLEKKYGKYEDLERNQNTKKMEMFYKEYTKGLKQQGIYAERERVDNLRRDASQARELAEKQTQEFVSSWLGKYGDTKLNGQGSAVYKGGKIVDRMKAKDIISEAVMYDIDRHYKYFSLEDKEDKL